MKKTSTAFAAGLIVAASFAPSAFAGDMASSNYVGVSIIGSSYADVDSRASFAGGTTVDHTAELDNGLGAAVRVGHKYDSIRAEIEFAYRDTDLGSLRTSSTTHTNVSGDAKIYTLMAKAIYDFETDSKVVPYVSAGLGGMRVKGDASYTDDNARTITESGSANTVAGQLGIGLGYEVSPGVSLVGGYSIVGAPTDDLGKDQYLVIHNVQVGINYSF